MDDCVCVCPCLCFCMCSGLCESVYVCECVRVVCANQWDYLCGLTGGIGKYISAHIPMCVCVPECMWEYQCFRSALQNLACV